MINYFSLKNGTQSITDQARRRRHRFIYERITLFNVCLIHEVVPVLYLKH